MLRSLNIDDDRFINQTNFSAAVINLVKGTAFYLQYKSNKARLLSTTCLEFSATAPEITKNAMILYCAHQGMKEGKGGGVVFYNSVWDTRHMSYIIGYYICVVFV